MTKYFHPVNRATYDAADGFGSLRGRRRPHKGIDYMVGSGTTVRAPADGVVIVRQWSSELGNVIGVAFDDGMFGGFAHNSAFIAAEGSRVVGGVTPLSLSGNTGSASNGPHLHFSLGRTPGAIFGQGYGSTLVDPYTYIQDHLAGTTGSGNTPHIERKANPVLSISRVIRNGVGEFIMYASATTVSLSVELSAHPDKSRRAFELGVASAIAAACGLPTEIPVLDDSPNGQWYLRNQLAAAAAGMPADFPLAPGNPFRAVSGGGGVVSGVTAEEIAAEVIRQQKLPGN